MDGNINRVFDKMFDKIVAWLQFNILIPFMPFIMVQVWNCILGYKTGLSDIISDYSGLAYSTSIILFFGVIDAQNRMNIVIKYMGSIYSTIGFLFNGGVYCLINLSDKIYLNIKYSDKVIFIILTIIMILNILFIIFIKIKDFKKLEEER